ncbi:MAG: sulfatase-like hydrolase/transferase [Acidobacteriota bacterium]
MKRPPGRPAPRSTRSGRSLLLLGGLAVGAACALGWATWRYLPFFLGDHPPERPNIVLVTIDTIRADRLGCYGYTTARTPTLDRIAADGIRFRTAFAPVPLTLPSHATMMTGQIPPSHSVHDNAASRLGHDVPVVPETLAAAGYATAAFVSGFPLDRRFGLSRGFHTYDDRFPRGRPGRVPYVERTADRTTDAAASWLATAQSPFFLWVHYFDPHAPYEPPGAYSDTGTAYDGEIAFVDEELARLLDALDRQTTIVIVAGDHGESLGEHREDTHGLFVYDSTLRVPLLIAGPGIRARVVGGAALLTDLAPTILKLAGCDIPGAMTGRLLLDPLPARATYAESLFGHLNCGWAPLYSLRDGRWKLIEAPSVELYDLETDPGEMNNVAGEQVAAVRSLREQLRKQNAHPVSEASAPDRETREKLAGLGYLSGGASTGSGRDPKDLVDLANELERAMPMVYTAPERAAEILRGICDADPQNPIARRTLATALAHQGRFDEAANTVESTIQAGTAPVDARVSLSEYLRLAGRTGAAVAAAQQAIKQDPLSPEAHLAAAKALLAEGRQEEASEAVDSALKLAPDYVDALQMAADLLISQGAFGVAAERLQRAVNIDPDDTATTMKYGTCLVRAGQIASAITVFEGLIEREPQNGHAMLLLAGALAKNGNAASAVKYFERAIAAGVKTPACYNGLAMARIETGDREGARDALRESLLLAPNQRDIRAMLESLDRTSR